MIFAEEYFDDKYDSQLFSTSDSPFNRRSPSKPLILSLTRCSNPFKTAIDNIREKLPTDIPIIATQPVNLLVLKPLPPNKNRFAMYVVNFIILTMSYSYCKALAGEIFLALTDGQSDASIATIKPMNPISVMTPQFIAIGI